MAAPAAYNGTEPMQAGPTTQWENDPARVHPAVKKYTQIAGAGKIYYYIDTCSYCANYSRYHATCKVRDLNNPGDKVKTANNPLPVSANWKCKFWEPYTEEKSSSKRGIKQRSTVCQTKPKNLT